MGDDFGRYFFIHYAQITLIPYFFGKSNHFGLQFFSRHCFFIFFQVFVVDTETPLHDWFLTTNTGLHRFSLFLPANMESETTEKQNAIANERLRAVVVFGIADELIVIG